jgi:hypothetical protein
MQVKATRAYHDLEHRAILCPVRPAGHIEIAVDLLWEKILFLYQNSTVHKTNEQDLYTILPSHVSISLDIKKILRE